MGGIGSGEHNRTTRLTVEECARLPVRMAVTELRSLGLLTDEDQVEFTLSWVRARVRLVATAQPAGGKRWWFECPGCQLRRAVLHRPCDSTTWQCRDCWDLGYRSRRLDEIQALQRQADKIRSRLTMRAIFSGKKVADQDTIPRPKRMRRSTYERALTRADNYEFRAIMLLDELIKRRFGSLSAQ